MPSYPVAQPRPRCVENRERDCVHPKENEGFPGKLLSQLLLQNTCHSQGVPQWAKLIFVKVEPRSTFTFTRSLLYIASISFTGVNFTCVRSEKNAR